MSLYVNKYFDDIFTWNVSFSFGRHGEYHQSRLYFATSLKFFILTFMSYNKSKMSSSAVPKVAVSHIVSGITKRHKRIKASRHTKACSADAPGLPEVLRVSCILVAAP